MKDLVDYLDKDLGASEDAMGVEFNNIPDEELEEIKEEAEDDFNVMKRHKY